MRERKEQNKNTTIASKTKYQYLEATHQQLRKALPSKKECKIFFSNSRSLKKKFYENNLRQIKKKKK
jgi:hypothetical protein